MIRDFPEMTVAGDQLRPGVTDADYRPAVEQVGWKSLVLHPRTMNEAIFVLQTKPTRGAQGNTVFIFHIFEFSQRPCRNEHVSILHLWRCGGRPGERAKIVFAGCLRPS